MLNVLIKAFGFVLIIIIGYTLKKRGIASKEHGQFLSFIIMNLTLPCALITSMNNLEITSSLLIALIIGFLANVSTNLFGFLSSKKETPINKAITMINMSGYNIGTFTLPFVQSFFPTPLVAYVCLFDTGNAMMCLGGTYTVASMIVSGNEKITLKSIIQKLFSSVSFCTYIILFIISLLNITIPDFVITIASIPGNANAFLAMLMIGIMLELDLDLSEIKSISKILISRYSISILFSLFIYFVLPLDISIKKMIILALFAPVSAVAPVFSTRVGSDSPVPAAVNSLSIIISICVLTCLVMIFI